jgi:hypothetical protein
LAAVHQHRGNDRDLADIIQNTQNLDGIAIQTKLDELIRSSNAENRFVVSRLATFSSTVISPGLHVVVCLRGIWAEVVACECTGGADNVFDCFCSSGLQSVGGPAHQIFTGVCTENLVRLIG